LDDGEIVVCTTFWFTILVLSFNTSSTTLVQYKSLDCCVQDVHIKEY
jgi:hypothetical protein